MKNILLILIILIVLYKLYIGCSVSEKFYDCKNDVKKCIENIKELTPEKLNECKALCKQ